MLMGIHINPCIKSEIQIVHSLKRIVTLSVTTKTIQNFITVILHLGNKPRFENEVL